MFRNRSGLLQIFIVTLYLSFSSLAKSVFSAHVKIRRLVLYPFSKLGDIFILLNPLDRMVVVIKLTLGKRSVYLPVAHPVEKHYFTAFKRAGDQVVPARFIGQLTPA